MRESKVETTTIHNNLALVSEEHGSRGFGRSRRLLTMVAAGFVFLAACLLFVDFRRLDHSAPRHEMRNRHAIQDVRPVKLSGRVRKISG